MITISQSLIKRFFKYDPFTDQWNYREFCPRKEKELSIDRIHEWSSDAMDCGKYFETLCLGSGRDGEMVLDLPRKKLTKAEQQANIIAEMEGTPIMHKGAKLTDQTRIDEQSLRFVQRCLELDIKIVKNVNTQVKILKQFSPDVLLSCNIDIFPTQISIGGGRPQLAIIDLKLTSDLNSTWGDFCWGEFEKMDPIQGYMYHYMVRDINPVLNPESSQLVTDHMDDLIRHNEVLYYYWVFNYKPGTKDVLRDQFFGVLWDDVRKDKLEEVIRKTASTISYYSERGWVAAGTYDTCKDCKCVGCDKKVTIQEV